MSALTVSVIIPAFNARSTVIDSIRSALDQTHPPLEVIVVDDGSTDGTGDAVRAAFGDRVTLISQENRGVAEARNRGIDAARGDYVQFLDSDDLLAPEKLERSLAACQDSGAAVAYSQAAFVESDGITPHPITFPELPSGDVLLEWLTGTMANGSYGVASSMFVRRAALLETGRFEKSCTPCEDWDMWIRLAAAYPFVALNEPLVIYRMMPTGLSRNQLKMAEGRLTVVRRARQLPEVQARLSRSKLDALEAGRWQVYAMQLWENGQRSEAREAFAAANRLVPSNMRRAFALLTYATSAASAERLARGLTRLRGMFGRR